MVDSNLLQELLLLLFLEHNDNDGGGFRGRGISQLSGIGASTRRGDAICPWFGGGGGRWERGRGGPKNW